MPTLKCCVNLWRDKTLLRYMYFCSENNRCFVAKNRFTWSKELGTVIISYDSVAMYTLWMPKVYLKTTGVFWSKEHNCHIIVVLNK